MNRKRVLIVEDDAAMRQVLHLRVKSQDYDSLPVGDSITALSEARKEPPDLIILDLGLPGGGGLAFLQRLSEQPALDAGAAAFFQKSADPEECSASALH
jgi:DNA-binding response OmpR family regulator